MKLSLHTTIDDKKIFSHTRALSSYIEELQTVAMRGGYEDLSSSINLSFDDEMLDSSLTLAKKKSGETLRYVVVIGIGGSNLGAKAVYDAMGGVYDAVGYGSCPQMVFLDTCDGRMLCEFLSVVEIEVRDKAEFLIVLISKSGGTIETLVNAEILLAFLKKQFGSIDDRVVVISDRESALWKRAKKTSWDVLEIPGRIGGRYSVMSSVGVFPLACVGIDVQVLLEGARLARKDGLLQDVKKNTALRSACFVYESYRRGGSIYDSFLFDPSLESLGKWYRQLAGESLGKLRESRWRKTRVGITPTVSIGSTDLHSVGQLYLAGPRDKVSMLVWRDGDEDVFAVPSVLSVDRDKDYLKKLRPSQVMRAIFDGVTRTYEQQELPFMRVEMTSNVRDIGYFLQWKELEVMFLAHLMGVNPFDQPAVELYKNETRAILGKMKR